TPVAPTEPLQPPIAPVLPPAGESRDLRQFLRDRALSRADAVREGEQPAPAPVAPAAQKPRYKYALAPKAISARNIKKGDPLAFKTERGATVYAKANALDGYAPLPLGKGFVLARRIEEPAAPAAPLELAPRETK